MRHRLPPLNTLRLFVAAARLSSFKSAAEEELLLTPSAVSHGIQSLEQWLGTPLFVRTAKGLTLTDAGTTYFPIVQSALEQLTHGTERISARPDRPRLHISAAPTFAIRFLVPMLTAFREEIPTLRSL